MVDLLVVGAVRAVVYLTRKPTHQRKQLTAVTSGWNFF
jgi:hypothetical protein